MSAYKGTCISGVCDEDSAFGGSQLKKEQVQLVVCNVQHFLYSNANQLPLPTLSASVTRSKERNRPSLVNSTTLMCFELNVVGKGNGSGQTGQFHFVRRV